MGAASSSRWRRPSAVQDTLSSASKIKVVVLGEAAVGKTTLFKRWMGSSLDLDYVATTTANFGVKLIQLEGHDPVVVELWDVPPQTFAGPNIVARYLRGTQAVVLVFSLQTPASWRVLPKYLAVARREIAASDLQSTPSLPIIMVGNKHDCINQDTRSEEEAARSWCKDHGAVYAEVSALARDSSAIRDVLKLVIQVKKEQ